MSSKAIALQDDTAVSTRAVYQPQSTKQKHIWDRCISTTIGKANPLRHSRAREFLAKRKYSWHSRMSPKSSKAKAPLDDTVVYTRTVYQP